MSTGTRLHATRLAKGHSLRDAATQSGVSPSTLSRMERNVGTVDTQVLFKVAAYCGVSVETLVTGKPAPVSDAEVDNFLEGHGYNLDALRTEINALIDELRETVKEILAHGVAPLNTTSTGEGA